MRLAAPQQGAAHRFVRRNSANQPVCRENGWRTVLCAQCAAQHARAAVGDDDPETAGAGSSAAAAGTSPAAAPPLTTDWEARRRTRVVDELFAASKKHKLAASREAVAAGVQALESSLVPGLKIDIEAMRAVDWVALCLDTSGAAARLVLLKTHLPRADLTRIVQRNPGLLLQDAATLDNARQVKHLLADAKDADALLTALPSLLDPRVLLSVLVRWGTGCCCGCQGGALRSTTALGPMLSGRARREQRQ